MNDAELMDQFIDALRDNPQAAPLPDLEPETVTLLRAMQPPAPPPYVQAIVWQQVERALPPVKAPRRVYHLGLAAATLVLVLLAGWILRPREAAIISQMQPETPTTPVISMGYNLGDVVLLSQHEVYAPQILPDEYYFYRGFLVNNGESIAQQYWCGNGFDVFAMQQSIVPMDIQFPADAYPQRVKVGSVWGELIRFPWTEEAINQLTLGDELHERVFISLPGPHTGEGQFLIWEKDKIHFLLVNIQSPWSNGYNACQLARSDMITLATQTIPVTSETAPEPTFLLEPAFFTYVENPTPPIVNDSTPLTFEEAQASVAITLPEPPIPNYYRFQAAYFEGEIITLRYEYGADNFPLIIRVEPTRTPYPIRADAMPAQRQLLGEIYAEYAFDNGIGSQWYQAPGWKIIRWQDGDHIIHLETSSESMILRENAFFALATKISQGEE